METNVTNPVNSVENKTTEKFVIQLFVKSSKSWKSIKQFPTVEDAKAECTHMIEKIGFSSKVLRVIKQNNEIVFEG